MKSAQLLLLAAAVAVITSSCEKERRIPYIAPDLSRWSKPYRGSDKLRLHVFKVGTIEVAGALIGEAVTSGTIELDLLSFVITHRSKGVVVFDPGLSPEFYTSKPPRDAAAKLLGIKAKEGNDLLSQMEAAGIDKKKVNMVVASSLHFYRAGAARLLKNALLVADGKEREAAEHRGLLGLYNPDDFTRIEKWRLLEFPPDNPYGTLHSHVDLLGDGSIIALPTPGLSRGGISLLVRLASRPVILVGDLAWREESLRFAEVPRIAANKDAWWDSAWRLKRFAELAPEILLVPGSDLSALVRLNPLPADIVLHGLKKDNAARIGQQPGLVARSRLAMHAGNCQRQIPKPAAALRTTSTSPVAW